MTDVPGDHLRSDPAGHCRRFDQARVLITGAGNGIGRACARRLAAEGAQVAVTDLDGEAARATVQLLEQPDRHAWWPMDITSRESVDRVVADVAETLGGLDALVNVAGADAGRVGNIEEIDDDTCTRMLDLNLVGAARCCRAVVPHLRTSTRHPCIVSVSSINALNAFGSLPYSAAKAGLGPLTINLAQSLAPHGIRVNIVAPGTIRSRLWGDQPGGADRVAALYPLGRVGEPEDIAAAVAFLASTDASWITGQTLPVEGGVLTSLAGRFLELSR
ncbi:MAG: SDR family NAD(P)-dependent oxidoreductase [Propionibacteriaceae bacterium]